MSKANEETSQVEGVVMCVYCNGTGEIETDNNEPIVKCPLCEFERELVKNQKTNPPEFQKVLDDNFWDLI